MGNENKKLIEVALPLDEINAACAREKKLRHGQSFNAPPVVGQAASGSIWRRIDDYEVKKYVLDALGVRSCARAINPVVEFVETELADLSGEYPTSELYNRYKIWCDETNHHKANSGAFVKRLKNALTKTGQLKRERVLRGYRYFEIDHLE